MEIRPLDLADSDQLARTHALVELVRLTDTPELPSMPKRLFAKLIEYPPPGTEARWYVAEDADEALGFLHVHLPMKENRHYAEAELAVHPDHRRRGVGTALLDHLLELARAEGRSELIALARIAWEGGPKRSTDGPEFLERHGFTAALTEVDRRMEISALDAAAEERYWAEATSASAGEYKLASWAGRTPEAYMEPLCRIDSMIFDEVPLGDVELGRREFDTERVRARDDNAEARGATAFRTVAVHNDSGHIVAHTAVYAFGDREDAFQAITIVDPAHRGHRLGLLVKLANLRHLRERFGHVKALWTGNADTNAHMVAINDRLGFRPVDARVSYKRRLDV